MKELTSSQWSQLKDAVLCAVHSTDSRSSAFDSLPQELQNHEVGVLLQAYLSGGSSHNLVSAAKLLAPDTDNFWVALERG